MQKTSMREIKLEINNAFVMNMMNYFMTQEGYLFVGNEKEIWLENLSHPSIQLIYFHQGSIYNEMQEQTLLKLIDRVRSRVRRRYLLYRLNVLIIQTSETSPYVAQLEKRYIKHVVANEAKQLKQDSELLSVYPQMSQVALEKTIPELIFELHHTSKSKAQAVQKTWMHQKYPLMTYLYLIVCVLLFIRISLYEEVNAATGVMYGAKYNPLIVNGDLLRLLTPAFVHLSLTHLLMNSIFIYQLGHLIEQTFGWWRTVLVMLGSALIGNLFSFAFSADISLGASTVAYGLLGAVLFLGMENPKLFMKLVRGFVFPLLVISIVWGLIDSTIDLYGHIGGFLGGFLTATIVGKPKSKIYWQRIVLAFGSATLLMTGTWVRGKTLTEETDFKALNQAVLYYYMQYGREEQIESLYESLEFE